MQHRAAQHSLSDARHRGGHHRRGHGQKRPRLQAALLPGLPVPVVALSTASELPSATSVGQQHPAAQSPECRGRVNQEQGVLHGADCGELARQVTHPARQARHPAVQ